MVQVKADMDRQPHKVLLPRNLSMDKVLQEASKVPMNNEVLAEARALNLNMDKNLLHMELNPDKPVKKHMEATEILMNKVINMARVSAQLMVIQQAGKDMVSNNTGLPKVRVHTVNNVMKILMDNRVMEEDSSMEATDVKVPIMVSNNVVMETMVVLSIVNMKAINTRVEDMETNMAVTNLIGNRN